MRGTLPALIAIALLAAAASARAVVIGYEAYLKGLTPDENGVYHVPPGAALEYRLAIDLGETEWDDYETGDITTTATVAIDAAISSYTLSVPLIENLPLEFSAALADFVTDDGGDSHGVSLVNVFSSEVLARDTAMQYSFAPLYFSFQNLIEVSVWGGTSRSGYRANPAVQLVVYRDGRDALDLQMPNTSAEASDGRVVILGLRIPLRADIGDGASFSISMPAEFFGPQSIRHPLPGYGAVTNARTDENEATTILPAPITINVQSRALHSLTLNGETMPALSLTQTRPNEPVTTTLRLSAADQFGAAHDLASVVISSSATNGAAISVRREDAADALSATLTITITPNEDADAVVSLRAVAGDVSAEASIGVDAVDRALASLVIGTSDTALVQQAPGEAVVTSFTLLAVDNYGRDDVLPVTVSLLAAASNGAAVALLDAAADGEIDITSGGVTVAVRVTLAAGRDSVLSLTATHDVLGAFNARVSISAAPIPVSMGFTGGSEVNGADMVVLAELLRDIDLFNRAYDANCAVANEAAHAEILAALRRRGIPVRHVTLGEALNRAACATVRQLDDGSGALLDADGDGDVNRDDVRIISIVLNFAQILGYAYDANGILIPERVFILDGVVRRLGGSSLPFPSGMDQVREIAQRVYLRLFHPSSSYR